MGTDGTMERGTGEGGGAGVGVVGRGSREGPSLEHRITAGGVWDTNWLDARCGDLSLAPTYLAHFGKEGVFPG